MATVHRSEPRARRQTVAPRRKTAGVRPRRPGGLRLAVQSMVTFARPIAALAIVIALIIGYNVVTSSKLFELRKVEVANTSPALAREVEQLVRRTVGETRLLDIDLETVKAKVETLPRVKQASVARVLPDGLRVTLNERQPAVLVRRESGALVWLDEAAIEIGEFSEVSAGEKVPPVAVGFSEGGGSHSELSEDRDRIALYQQLEREFSEGPEPVWDLVDEVDLTYLKFVNLRLANSAITVKVGGKDFRNRFETALKILGAIRRGDAELLGRFRVQDAERLIANPDNISFIDTMRPDRPVVAPGMEKAGKQEKKKS